ncbi:MAG TPA: glycosyltransferase N-terminal domain-containing protein [Bacteroidales bacterium]|nr:glycosyltransferase N-terminal domain-containing protein [Bacteroidales bacterium]
MRLLYNTGIFLYSAIAWIISPFNRKAAEWVNGRKNWYDKLKQKVIPGEKYIWIHCASLGEFEQGRPVIESLKRERPACHILLSFFSPSGYEIRKDYPLADIICYLPYDTPGNAEKFISLVNPSIAILVKYEFWYNFISGLNRKNIPLYLISGIFRKEQHFFKWYGGFFRDMLRKFARIFVQDKESSDVLGAIAITNVTVAGDTRFDRVAAIAAKAKEIPQIELFREDQKLFLAGSSWKQDEEIIARYINSHPETMKWIFAPHEIDRENIERLEKLFTVKSVRFSEFSVDSKDARVMIIDNIGMLSSAYRYAGIAAVGGGFGKGIHNILEPACWSIPVLFGPNYGKFREAIDLINLGGAKSFNDYTGFEEILDIWISDAALYRKASALAGEYVNNNMGATSLIMKEIV